MGNPIVADDTEGSDNERNKDDNEPPAVFPSNHFLGLPLEVRDRIWTLIFFDAMKNSGKHIKWNARRETVWDQVPLTCRQIYHETKDYWPRAAVRAEQLPTKFVIRGLTIPVLKRFHHLTVELPRDYSTFPYDQQTAAMLDFLSPFLRDLRLYFIGEQGPLRRNERTSKNCLLNTERARREIVAESHGDGEASGFTALPSKRRMIKKSAKASASTTDPPTPQAIIDAIQKMTKLVTLVIDEIDFLLLSSALNYLKPDLERLHITTSPDAILHRHAYGTNAPEVVVQPRLRPGARLRKLCLSANAVLDANRLAITAASTLREVTWTVPIMDRRHEVRCEWILQTSELLRCLSIRATNLTSLRICLEQEISEDRLYDTTLVGAIRNHLHSFKSLQSLELHILTDSRFLAAETLQCLPDSLKRFYTTEDFIPPKILLREIEHRYLSPYSSTLSGRLGFIGYEFTTPEAWTTAMKLNGRLLDRERNFDRLHILSNRITNVSHHLPNPPSLDSNSTSSSSSSSSFSTGASPHPSAPFPSPPKPNWLSNSLVHRPTILRPDDTSLRNNAARRVQPMPLHQLLPLPALNDDGDFAFDGRYEVEHEALDGVWRAEKCATGHDLAGAKWLEQKPVRVGAHWIAED